MSARTEGLQSRITKAVDAIKPQSPFSRGIDGQPMLQTTPDQKRQRRVLTGTAVAAVIPLALASCSSNGENATLPTVTVTAPNPETSSTLPPSPTRPSNSLDAISPTGMPSISPSFTEPSSSPVTTSPEASPTTYPESGLEGDISSLTEDLARFIVTRVNEGTLRPGETRDTDTISASDGSQETEYTLQINTGTAKRTPGAKSNPPYEVYNLSVVLKSPKEAPDLTTVREVTISKEYGSVPYATTPFEGKAFTLEQAVDHTGAPLKNVWTITWDPYKPGLTTHEGGKPIGEVGKTFYANKLQEMRGLFGAASKATYREP